MKQVTAEQLLVFLGEYSELRLTTLTAHKPFTAHLKNGGVEYTPEATKKPRPHERKYLERVCEIFSRTNSFHTKDYTHLTQNASYSLALIDTYLNSTKSRDVNDFAISGTFNTSDVFVFYDRVQLNAHDLFQKWRAANPNGLFINQKSATNNLLHTASCQHLGDAHWKREDSELDSLTKKRKTCARTVEILKIWATKHHLILRPCIDCNPESISTGILSEPEYDEALQHILSQAKSIAVCEEFADVSPERVETVVRRILRDVGCVKEMKRMYQGKCQICGEGIGLPDGSLYAEAHHIKPLGNPHSGPDDPSNLLCVCPNHHVALDYRAIPIVMAKLRLHPRHKINPKHVDYHNKLVEAVMAK